MRFARRQPKGTDMKLEEVWYVVGEPDLNLELAAVPTLWLTKLDAERYARECFPNEDEQRRYARIRYRRVYSYDEN